MTLVTQSCPTLCNPMDCRPPGSPVHGDSPGKNTGVGCYALLQGIFPTQGSNPGLPHCSQIYYRLSHQGSPCIYIHTYVTGSICYTFESNTVNQLYFSWKKKRLCNFVHWVELPDLANKVQVMRHSFIRCSSEILSI